MFTFTWQTHLYLTLFKLHMPFVSKWMSERLKINIRGELFFQES